ncbi:cyclomaltodextrinase N-terminal domain-containing protein [Geofilum rubicundum]|uniref:Neopullulanase n=1 Tax=Geofilum rubicundum JCM 15548 TaxID=1236989 RepID=A0A0E9M152_9BACT|nr:cyclomaltodextrinase N-terminal domain-containing protein [Geofilum rubicundum]GAO31537.1 neopullulanase [Geofilum rubicundum JCM 15548]
MTSELGKIKVNSIVFLVLLLAISGPSWSQFSANKMACWPQEWWIGMKYNKVQVLIKGNNLSTARAAVSHSGVSINDQYGAKNKDYLFVELDITKNASAGMFAIRITRGNTPVGTVNFTLRNRTNNYFPSPLTGADAIYQIVPDRFANGNPDNDNIIDLFEKADRSNPSGVHGGDIQGLSNAMNYIKDLGFNTVEFTPLYESNQLILSYDKFAPTSHFNVDKRIGSLNDIKNTIQQFRNNQLKVIITQVFHKAGNQHVIFQSPPDPDWVFKRDLLSLEKPNPLVYVDPYAAQEDIDRHSKIWESFDRPALNLQNKELKKYLVQHVLWWVETFQPDGVKIDQTHLCHPEFLAQLTQVLRDEYPNLNILAAPEAKDAGLNAYWQHDHKNKFQFTHLTDGPLKEAVNDAFAAYSDTHEALFPIYQTLASDHIYNDAINQIILNGDNHHSTDFLPWQKKIWPCLNFIWASC